MSGAGSAQTMWAGGSSVPSAARQGHALHQDSLSNSRAKKSAQLLPRAMAQAKRPERSSNDAATHVSRSAARITGMVSVRSAPSANAYPSGARMGALTAYVPGPSNRRAV